MGRPVLASDRRYVFDAGIATVWSALERVDAYRTWWPWLDRFDADGMWPGAEWRCAVRSPLRRTLRFTIAIADVVEPRAITAQLRGDLVGTAAVTIRELDPRPSRRSEVRLVSELVPRDTVVAAATRLARPLAGWAHDTIVDRGARQFADALR